MKSKYISILAGALHNIHEFVLYGLWSDKEYPKLYFQSFGRDWVNDENDFSLFKSTGYKTLCTLRICD